MIKFFPSLTLPEGVKKLNFSPASSGVKTGVQSVRNVLKTLDSGFRRNDVKRNQIYFFTASPSKGWSWYTLDTGGDNRFYNVM